MECTDAHSLGLGRRMHTCTNRNEIQLRNIRGYDCSRLLVEWRQRSRKRFQRRNIRNGNHLIGFRFGHVMVGYQSHKSETQALGKSLDTGTHCRLRHPDCRHILYRLFDRHLKSKSGGHAEIKCTQRATLSDYYEWKRLARGSWRFARMGSICCVYQRSYFDHPFLF